MWVFSNRTSKMKNIWEENIPEEQMLSWVMDMMGPCSADSIQTRCERVSQPHPAPGKAWLPLGREVGGLYSDCEYLNTLRTRQVAEHLW